MADIKEEINKEAASPDLPEQAAMPPRNPSECDPNQPKPEMSRGERWYNRIVYQGVNYWLNLGISLVLTDFFTHNGGKRFFDRWVNTIAKGLTATKLTGPKIAHHSAKVALGTFSLNGGGNLLLIPMKIMEDRKRPIVHWLNKNIFKEKQLAPDGHQETPDEIYIEEEQPKQSWLRVIGRRALACGATIVTGLSLDRALRKPLDKPIIKGGKTITHIEGQDRFTDWTVKGANYVLDRVPGGKTITASPTAQRYMGFAALDWIYTVITSKIMHMTNGAKKAHVPTEISDDCDPPGIIETDEIKILPQANKPAATVTPASPEEKRNGYKTKSLLPTEKYADRAKAADRDYTLAP